MHVQKNLSGLFDQGINVITKSNAWQGASNQLTAIAAPIAPWLQMAADSPILQTAFLPITLPIELSSKAATDVGNTAGRAAVLAYDNPIIKSAILLDPLTGGLVATSDITRGAIEGGVQGAGKGAEPHLKNVVKIAKVSAPIWGGIPGVNLVGGGILAIDALQAQRQKLEEEGRNTDAINAKIEASKAKLASLKEGNSESVANDAYINSIKNRGNIFGVPKIFAIAGGGIIFASLLFFLIRRK